jgi:hypothetical protein
MQEALKEIRQKQQTRPEDAGLLKSQPVLK